MYTSSSFVINALTEYFIVSSTVLGKGLKVLPEGGYFQENDKVTLSCVSTTGQSGSTQVSWYKNNVIILSDNNDVFIDNDGSLTIMRFQSHDEGYYQCETNRGEYRQSPVVSVILFGKILNVGITIYIHSNNKLQYMFSLL